MIKNPFWTFFLCVIALATLWFIGRALYLIYDYSTLQNHTFPKTIDWSVEALSDEKYVPKASYTYEVEGELMKGSSLLTEKIYRNAYATNEAIQELNTHPKEVYYNPKNPQKSSIQRDFPTKECIYALILTAILIYFIGLGIYVSRAK